MKYTKNGVEIEALQFTMENKDSVIGWAKQYQMNIQHTWDEKGRPAIIIPKLEGETLCLLGDYLIREPFPTDWQRISSCKADVFEASYKMVDS